MSRKRNVDQPETYWIEVDDVEYHYSLQLHHDPKNVPQHSHASSTHYVSEAPELSVPREATYKYALILPMLG